MNRDSFDKDTIEKLRRRVNGVCSNPDCKSITQGPSKNENEVQYFGIAAHICAASKGGPRYNPNQTAEERRSSNNGIFLCSNCASMIDKNNGIDYPEELLRNWKKQAEKEALENLNKNVKKDGWTVIEFDNLEENYSAALAGVGLTQKNVNSCPRFTNTINEVKKYLELSYNCCLYGVSGSGKSLTAFQIAYDYHNNGYDVLKLKSDYKLNEIKIPQKDKLFLIIDNTHNLSLGLIEDICSKTNKEILALFLSSSEIFNLRENEDGIIEIEHIINPIKISELPSVQLNPSDAIPTLKEYCLRNSQKLLPLVQKLDDRIGEGYMDEPIERRIEAASRENKNTPWLFNFVLTGGWRKAYKDVENLKSNSRTDILLLIIALWQIFTSDKGTTAQELKKSALLYSNSEEWFIKTIKLLKEEKLLQFDNNYIKLNHIEYSRRVIASLGKNPDKEIIDLVIKLLINFITNYENKRGLRNVFYSLSFDMRTIWDEFIDKNEYVISELICKILNDYNYDKESIYLLEETLRFNRKFINIAISNFKIIKNWILNINSETAYALSMLLNTFINERENFDRKLIKVDKNFAISLARKISSLELSDELFYWSHFVSRLSFFVSKKWREVFMENLELRSFNFKSFDDLYLYKGYAKCLFLTDLGPLLSSLKLNEAGIIKYYNKDAIKANEYFHEAFWYIFGDGPFKITTTKEQKEAAKSFLKNLNVNSVASRFNKLKKREFKAMGGLLLFTYKMDNSKYNKIIKQLNFDYIFEFIDFDNLTKLDYELHTIYLFTGCKYGLDKVWKFFKDNIEKIKIFPKKLCYIIPDLIVDEIKKDNTKKVSLEMSVISWSRCLPALKSLANENKEVTQSIIMDNIEDIVKAVYLPQDNDLDDADNFLNFVDKLMPEFKNLIFKDFDIEKARKHWQDRLSGKRTEKKAVLAVLKLAQKSNKEIKKLADELLNS